MMEQEPAYERSEASPECGTALELSAFHAPDARSRIAPFWFWNCEMSAERVRLQVRQMAEAGCGGFFIHARQGLALPYLSDEWFGRVRLAVETAKAYGLHAWLYDEYPYPSGIAGGLLTANRPEFRARVLEQSALDTQGETLLRREFPLGRLVSAVACPVENGRVLWERAVDVRRHFGAVLTREQFWRWPMSHIPYNEKRFMADEGRLALSWSAPPGQWRVFVGIEREQRGFKYFDWFFDPLQPGAAEEFLRLTHERYAEHLAPYFGSTIPGIFTDETEPPSWSPQIEAHFKEAHLDLDLTQLLPALRHDDHPRAAEVRHAFRQCALRLFQERWEQPIAEWCARYHLIWTAEKPTWRPAQFLDIAQPATDAGHRRIGVAPEPLTAELRANHRAAMAAAEQSGTEEVRCECFHSLGWGATLQDQKWAVDWLCVQGVNRFTPHAFYATSAGLAKHDAAPSFFAENPYWQHFRLFADYTARLSLAMSTGREVAPIAVLHPTASLWGGGPAGRQAREEYEWLMNTLLDEHHMFHPVDALALLRAQAETGSLCLGRTRYETLLVPPLTVVDNETAGAIRAALAAGLAVLMAAPLSSSSQEINGTAGELTKLPGVTLVENRSAWLAKLETQRRLSITDEGGQQLAGVWALWREAGTQQLLFVANTEAEETTVHIEIAAGVAAWQHWSLEEGSAAPCPAESVGGRSRFSLHLPPYGSALFVGEQAVGEQTSDSLEPASPSMLKSWVLPTAGDWEMKLGRPNALRLNRWRLACDDEHDWPSWELNDEHLPEVEALPLMYLDQVERRWRHLCDRPVNSPVWYRCWVNCETVPDDLGLLLEQGAILGNWSLWINGASVSRENFLPPEYHSADKIACRVAHLFLRGENLIALRVDGAPEMGGLRTPLHLIGSFALGGSERRALIELPTRGPFGDLAAAGLPHFSGTVTYRRILEEGLPPDTQAIKLPPGFSDVAELKVNGQSLGVRAWSPYQWRLPSPLQGAAEMEVAVTNTLLPFMEGQFWDASTQSHHPV